MKKIQNSNIIRQRFAFTEQTLLPLKYSSGKRSLYPKRFGTWRIVKALKKKMVSKGIKILTKHSVCNLDLGKEAE